MLEADNTITAGSENSLTSCACLTAFHAARHMLSMMRFGQRRGHCGPTCTAIPTPCKMHSCLIRCQLAAWARCSAPYRCVHDAIPRPHTLSFQSTAQTCLPREEKTPGSSEGRSSCGGVIYLPSLVALRLAWSCDCDSPLAYNTGERTLSDAKAAPQWSVGRSAASKATGQQYAVLMAHLLGPTVRTAQTTLSNRPCNAAASNFKHSNRCVLACCAVQPAPWRLRLEALARLSMWLNLWI